MYQKILSNVVPNTTPNKFPHWSTGAPADLPISTVTPIINPLQNLKPNLTNSKNLNLNNH